MLYYITHIVCYVLNIFPSYKLIAPMEDEDFIRMISNRNTKNIIIILRIIIA